MSSASTPSESSAGASSSSDDSDHVPETDTLVLSHAAKRKRKKEERKHIEFAESSPTKKRKLQKDDTIAKQNNGNPGSEHPKRQNSVWVGNLSYRTTPESLKVFFDGVGEITRVHMPSKLVAGGSGGQARRENRGFVVVYATSEKCNLPHCCRFAYVDFATADSKVVAITLSEQHLDGRKLLIKDGVYLYD